MSLADWKQIIVTQVFSGSVSLVASSMIVAFTATNGLNNSYKRIIFGLSVSDIFQSLSIVVGPWVTPSDVPQAIWGLGNVHTCRLDGFLFLVGTSAAPMYTVFISVFYVCKLNLRMTDLQFAQTVEKKGHLIIIITNLVLYLTALGLGTINPSTHGSFCFSAATPTGCRQNPEIFGDCDPIVKKNSIFFIYANTVVIPLSCIVVAVGCLAMIFRNVIKREQIFGTNRLSVSATTEPSHQPTSANRGDRRARRYLRSTDSSALTTEAPISMIQIDRDVESSELTSALGLEDGPPPSQSSLHQQPCSNIVRSETQGDSQFKINSGHESTYETSLVLQENDTSIKKGEEENSCLREIPLNRNVPSEAMVADSSPDILPLTEVNGSAQVEGESGVNRDMIESLSRLYKKELVTQACCYVLVFSVCMLPFLVINMMLVVGTTPKNMKALFWGTSALFPLAGFFNIIVYTRPNVSSFRRSNPEYSRLRSFWLVLKAGGEIPNLRSEN